MSGGAGDTDGDGVAGDGAIIIRAAAGEAPRGFGTEVAGAMIRPIHFAPPVHHSSRNA